MIRFILRIIGKKPAKTKTEVPELDEIETMSASAWWQ